MGMGEFEQGGWHNPRSSIVGYEVGTLLSSIEITDAEDILNPRGFNRYSFSCFGIELAVLGNMECNITKLLTIFLVL